MEEQRLTFEQAMARLEKVVTLLENGDAPLDESLKLFEEGSRLTRQCTAMLDQAEQKVVQLEAAVSKPNGGEE